MKERSVMSKRSTHIKFDRKCECCGEVQPAGTKMYIYVMRNKVITDACVQNTLIDYYICEKCTKDLDSLYRTLYNCV